MKIKSMSQIKKILILTEKASRCLKNDKNILKQ